MRRLSSREEIVALTGSGDLFARYAVPERPHGAWALGDAVGYLRESRSGKANLTVWGPRSDLASLLLRLADEGVLSPTLDHVSVPAASRVALEPWRTEEGDAWDWMATMVVPPVVPAEARLVELDDQADAQELQELADRENPLSEGYPGTGRSERWVGLRDDTGRIVACAALHRLASGTAHLSGILVASDHRGEGLGRAMTSLLTRDVLATEPVCTLGMYADNAVARSLYHSLGYVTDKAWWSCRLV